MTVSSWQSRTPLDFFKKTHSVPVTVFSVVRFHARVLREVSELEDGYLKSGSVKL